MVAELTARAGFFEGLSLASVFFGGGTPSLWATDAVRRVVDALREAFESESDLEVTAECNPSSLDERGVEGLRAAGINRFSVGVQSLDAAQLRHLGRLHGVEGALAATRAAVASGARVSADLIFGLPGQRPEEAAEHAAALVDLGLSHLSAYALTIEPGTRFGELARRGRLPLAAEDAVCDAFLAIEEALRARGLDHYEVSNYARPGDEARHNLGYWRGAPYLGLGCAAVGFGPMQGGSSVVGVRYRNETDPARYVARASTMVSGVPSPSDGMSAEVEALDAETLLRERLMLGLRLEAGLDLDRACTELGLVPKAARMAREKALGRLVAAGDVVVESSRLRVSPTRRLRTDGIAAQLM